MDFIYDNFKKLTINLSYFLFAIISYLFLSNVFVSGKIQLIYSTPIILSVFFRRGFKNFFMMEVYLFFFGIIDDILTQKMLGITSIFNVLIYYIFLNLSKKSNYNQGFIYSILATIFYIIYNFIVNKFNFYMYNYDEIVHYNLFALSFAINFVILFYIYFIYKPAGRSKFSVRRA